MYHPPLVLGRLRPRDQHKEDKSILSTCPVCCFLTLQAEHGLRLDSDDHIYDVYNSWLQWTCSVSKKIQDACEAALLM